MSTQHSDLLSADQRKALQEIYYRFNRDSAWPMFQRMSRILRQKNMNEARQVLRGLPGDLLFRPWRGSAAPQPNDELKLTLLGLEAAGGTEDVRLFIAVVRLLAEVELRYTGTDSAGSGYAALALLRAILDHIPPVLGYGSFKEVVSNHAWSRTDKDHMKSLLAYKPLGDDALHRMISSEFDALGIADAPPRQWINRLLQELAKRL